ncbi:MAG: zinc ribbon domain-containing protein [Candidatus Pacearchaeota archaeon]
MGSCIDLRNYQDPVNIQDAFSKIVSGKAGYKAVIEKRVIPPKCVKCGRGGDPEQKFCPQCGGKMKVPLTNCPGCKVSIGDEKFCTNCGKNLEECRNSE